MNVLQLNLRETFGFEKFKRLGLYLGWMFEAILTPFMERYRQK